MCEFKFGVAAGANTATLAVIAPLLISQGRSLIDQFGPHGDRVRAGGSDSRQETGESPEAIGRSAVPICWLVPGGYNSLAGAKQLDLTA